MAERLRLGIIGCGGMMGAHFHNGLAKFKEYTVVAMCDPVAKSAEGLADKYFTKKNRPSLYRIHTEMIRRETLDAVFIISPHVDHYPQATHALKNGLHVLVEKPMTVTVASAVRLVKLAKQKRRKLLIAFPGPYTGEFQYARQVIRSGQLGKITMVSAWCNQDWMQHAEGRWRSDPAIAGGGQLYDSGSHMINAVLWLTDLKPQAVVAFTENKHLDVDVNSTVSIRFEGGALGSLSVSGDTTKFYEGVRIFGEKGVIETQIYGGPRLEHVDKQGQTVHYPPVVPQGNNSVAIFGNFARVIHGKEKPHCPGDYGIIMAKLGDAIYQSAATGKVVKLRN